MKYSPTASRHKTLLCIISNPENRLFHSIHSTTLMSDRDLVLDHDLALDRDLARDCDRHRYRGKTVIQTRNARL
jgi:hypothetical protein